MQVKTMHSWDVSAAEARAIQADLAGQVALSDTVALDEIAIVAGVDNAYVKIDGEQQACAAIVALTFPTLEVIETAVAWRPVTFPYVPGLLSFREIPAVLAACAELTATPDVILCDGQGYAHPRRFGLASHLGVLLNRPTIGCAKSRLVGHYVEPADHFGAESPLIDRGEVVGAVLRIRPGRAPLFISPGHNVSVESAVAIALTCSREGEAMPVPTGLAHETVTRERRARLAS
jgi:deoxyribonuclease V